MSSPIPALVPIPAAPLPPLQLSSTVSNAAPMMDTDEFQLPSDFFQPSSSAAAHIRASNAAQRARLQRSLAAYEVIDLASESEDDDDMNDGAWRGGGDRKDKKRSLKEMKERASIIPDSAYPQLEVFTLDVMKSRVFSGLTLRRRTLPRLYPPSPPPEEKDDDEMMEESKENEGATPQKKRKRAPRKKDQYDYYDTSDSFIDDSELMLDEEEDEGEMAVLPHGLNKEQLEELYGKFSVISSAALLDAASHRTGFPSGLETAEKDATAAAAAKKKPPVPLFSATSQSAAKGTDKSKLSSQKSKPLSSTPGLERTPSDKGLSSEAVEAIAAANIASRKKKEREKEKGQRSKASGDSSETGASPPAPLPPQDLGSLDKEWNVCFERLPASRPMVALLEEVMAEYHNIVHGGSNPPPPPSLQSQVSGNITTVNATADENATAAASANAASAPMDLSQPTPTAPSSSNPAPTGAAGEAPQAAAGSAGDAGRSGRVGLRAKAAAPVAPKLPKNIPETLGKLLGKLGALLESEAPDEGTINKFIAVLTSKLLWSRQVLRTRLIIGRLEGQVTKYLRERFDLYCKVRDAIKEDIEAQARAFLLSKGETLPMPVTNATEGSTDAPPAVQLTAVSKVSIAELESVYAPNWTQYMRVLLDYATYTDDILDAIEELETFNPPKKKASTTGEGEAGAAPSSTVAGVTTAAADSSSVAALVAAATRRRNADETENAESTAKDELTQARTTILATVWLTFNIPPESFPAEHLPVILSITSTLYANLPLLWMQPNGSTLGVTEQMVEKEIDASELEAQNEIARKEAEEKAAQEAIANAAKREEEEKRMATEAEKRATEEEMQREVQRILDNEKQRKAQKAAKEAAKEAAKLADSSASAAVAAAVKDASSSMQGGSSSAAAAGASPTAADAEKKRKRKRSESQREPDMPVRSNIYAMLPPLSERWKLPLLPPTAAKAAPTASAPAAAGSTVPASPTVIRSTSSSAAGAPVDEDAEMRYS